MTDRSSAAQGFYGRWAGLYDLVARHTPGIGSLRSTTADALALSPGDTVVEMGCGTGANLPYLRERVGPDGTVVGVDFTRGVLDRARRLVAGEPNVHLVRADAIEPPISRPVDAILGTFVVGMFADPAATIDRWCDLLAPGGRVVLLDAKPSERPYYGPIVNVPLWAVTVASTPSPRRLASPHRTLDRRVRTAREALADRGTVDVDEDRTFGLIRLTRGIVE